MEEKILTGKMAALQIADEAVRELGYTPKRLKEETRLTFPTLRRIHNQKLKGKSPVNYYLEKFISILEKEYQRLLRQADTKGMNYILRIMRKILLSEHFISYS